MTAAQKLDFAAAAKLAASSGPRAVERRRFRRMPMVVAGRMLDAAGREHDCRTLDLSPGDARITSSTLPAIDDQVVLYLNGFGRLAGRVARRCPDEEVAIIFEASKHKREKMAEALIWRVNGERLGLLKTPDAPPEAPAQQPSTTTRVETEFGDIIEAEVLDFSLSGMTLKTASETPPISSWVKIGGLYGRVVRPVEGGFAVDFEPRAIARYRDPLTHKG
ncbi:MAG: PilZ domain-containing protein [Hyphomonadaceae bacterium]|nr:PilZ domain-containing protein [Hyphomonadaceae bacterium]